VYSQDVKPVQTKDSLDSKDVAQWLPPTLNQQVPGSSPGRRTKVVKFYGLMHPNRRADWVSA
jgi:hypothetical protein